MTPSSTMYSLSFSSMMVSPLLISLQPVMAPISPTPISFMSYASSALILNKDIILSVWPVFEFTIFYLFFKTPEYTLKKVTSPFSLSFTTLKAKAHNFSFLFECLVNTVLVTLSLPWMTRPWGEGRYLIIASIRG